METHFAPAERDEKELVREQIAQLAKSATWDLILDLVPGICFVVNAKRQIIFANSAALENLGTSAEKVIGARPGEILGCINACEASGGCGCSEACSVCGAIRAILEALDAGNKSVREFRLTSRRGSSTASVDMRVTATPIMRADTRLALVTLDDISDEKRRQVLERLFFHDIMNGLSSIQAGVILLEQELGPDFSESIYAFHLKLAANNLIDEVERQRQIATMERGDLAVNFVEVGIARLLGEIANQASMSSWAAGIKIETILDEVPPTIRTDPVLLRRVIGNMLKNALEASRKGDEVLMKLEPRGEGIAISVHNASVMSRDVQLQVFQRSFSTKGKGRGIGTWSMKILAESYLGGSIGFESAEGEGTTFTLRLPISPAR